MAMTLRVLLLLSIVVVCYVAATGCGEPYVLAPTDSKTQVNGTCSDWQCSRKVISTLQSSSANDTDALQRVVYCVRGLDEGEPCANDDDCYHGLICNVSSHTCAKGKTSKVAWQGYLAIVIAVIFFGTNFIPAKSVEAGNGLYFQWCMSVGILMVGLCVQLIRGTFYFYSYAMLGGMLWALGNTFSIPVIQLIGMGLGVAIWGVTNMCVGWAAGKFGVWGVAPESIKIEWLSYLGVGVGILGLITLALVQPSSNSKDGDEDDGYPIPADDDADRQYNDVMKNDPLLNPMNASNGGGALGSSSGYSERRQYDDGYMLNQSTGETAAGLKARLGPVGSRILGVIGALTAGTVFGFNMVPVQALMNQYKEKSLHENEKYSPDGLDYAMSHFCGIFMTTTILISFFLFLRRFWAGMPSWFPTPDFGVATLPGIACGAMWAVAQVSWFVANTNLGLVVSFPMVAIGPGAVANLWGIFLFREVRGVRNFLTLALAFGFVGASSMCTVLAKQGV